MISAYRFDRQVRFAVSILACAIAATTSSVSCAGAADETDPVTLRELPAVKQLQREMAREGERRILEARERARREARAKKHGPRRRGERAREARNDERAPVDETPMHTRLERLNARPGVGTYALPANVRLNNPAADSLDSAQSEVSIAIDGRYGLAGWNDGQGFYRPPNGQGVAYTTNGGATWTDVGLPPLGGTISDWTSDPVVAVNEKTGEFWFCSLTDNGANNNGIGVVRATFPGGVFTWGTPNVVADVPNVSDALDKPWMVADSTSGNLYLTYTHFTLSSADIGFLSSPDGGVNWSTEVFVSNNPGNVQGSRPAVAGDGTVYVIWKEIGPVDVDYVEMVRSTDGGLTFDPETNAAAFYDNFGTGAPGFNRNRNVVEPCPVVDRSSGPHRGRFYLVLHESLDFYDDPIGGGGNKNEIENNNFFNRATPFTPGQRLRGSLGTTTDLDVFSFNATAGTSYTFFCDSIPRPLYTMRIFCGADTLTRLAFSGDVATPPGSQSLIIWTAPTTGTYYFRMAYVAGGTGTGGYRVITGIAAHGGGEPGRDQRDVVVRYSDDGGVNWSPGTRVNDDAARFDDFLPEIGVTCEGYPYCAWYDYRDATTSCNGQSHVYVSRSVDGGDTWAASQRVTTAPTAWTTAGTNIQPNMGDYIGLYAGGSLALGWGDARAGEADVNVWGTNVAIDYDIACPRDTIVDQNATLVVNVPVTNHNPLFANTYDYTVSNDRGWTVTGSAGTVTAAANGGMGSVGVSITLSDTALAPGRVCVTVAIGGAKVKQCCFRVTPHQTTGVSDPVRAGFAIHATSPNPATNSLSVTFSLPSWAPARLQLIDVNGRRVAGRDVGSAGPGRHTVNFGRDIAGLPAGIYAVELSQGGRILTSKVSIIR